MLKIIICVTAGGGNSTLTITGASSTSYDSVIFNAVGETLVLIQSNSEWHVLASNGATIS